MCVCQCVTYFWSENKNYTVVFTLEKNRFEERTRDCKKGWYNIELAWTNTRMLETRLTEYGKRKQSPFWIWLGNKKQTNKNWIRYQFLKVFRETLAELDLNLKSKQESGCINFSGTRRIKNNSPWYKDLIEVKMRNQKEIRSQILQQIKDLAWNGKGSRGDIWKGMLKFIYHMGISHACMWYVDICAGKISVCIYSTKK